MSSFRLILNKPNENKSPVDTAGLSRAPRRQHRTADAFHASFEGSLRNHQGRILVTDRYPVYDYLPAENHQVCWAHLKRDFQKISERPGKAGQIGRRLLITYEQIFDYWKTDFQDNKILSKKRKKRLRYLKNKLHKWLVMGMHCGHPKTQRTCENILEQGQSLWRFFEIADVPPTNNQAERQLRPLVISKKLTFGTQSDRGSRFIERIFTAVMTCQQQQRDIFTFICTAIEQHFLKQKSPSLAIINS